MKKITKQAGIFIILLTIIAALLALWSIVEFRPHLPSPAFVRGFLIFFVLALILDLFAPRFGEYCDFSLSFGSYLAITILYGFHFAVAAALISMALRQIFVRRRSIWFRFSNFSTGITKICLSGIVYLVANHGSSFLSPVNTGAIIASSVVYYVLDYYLPLMAIELSDNEFAKPFTEAYKNARLSYFSSVLLGVLAILSIKFNSWLVLLPVMLFIALRQSVAYGLRQRTIIEQEDLEAAIDGLQEDVEFYKKKTVDLTSEMARKAEEQAIMIEMGESLGTSINIESTLEIVASMVRKMIRYQSCVIFLKDVSGTLYAAKSVTPYRDLLEYSSLLKLEESILSLVVQKKKPVLVSDMHSVSEQRIFKDERCVLCVPLIVKNEVIGVIYLGATNPGAYKEEHLNLLASIGNAASTAIKTSQLYDQAEQKNVVLSKLNSQLDNRVQSFEMLLSIGQKLGSSLNLDETQKIIIDGLEEMFRYQTVAVFLIKKEPEGLFFTPTKFRSPYEQFFKDLRLPFDDETNIMGWIAKYRRQLLITDTRETRLRAVIENERSVMVSPMIVENEITGGIYVGHSSPQHFDEEALGLLEAVAHNSAMAIKNAEIYETTAMKAVTDGLTGLYTHRYFQERISEEINYARRRQTGIALLMLDADHFKTYNDTLGHPEGDMVLKTIADLMRQFTRDSDIIFRVGGDEFIILLKEIDRENAFNKAEAIRQAVQAKFYDHQVQITTSIGIACFPEDGAGKKELIASADAALYQSKKLGRNRVSMAAGPVSSDFKKEPLPRG